MKKAEPSKIKIVSSFKEFIKASFPHLLMLLILVACAEEEPVYPGLDLERQGLSSSWSYGDTMYLNFRASETTSYSLALMQGALALPLNHRLVYREGDNYELEVIWADRYLESGNYEIRIQAFNGDEGVSTFFPISYSGLPLQFTGYALLGESKLTLVDPNQSRLDLPLTTNYDQVMVSSRDSLIYLAAFADEKLSIRSLEDFTQLSELALPAPVGSRSYYDFIKTAQGLYLLQSDGEIKYLASGQIQASVNVDQGQGERARQGAVIGNRFAAVIASIGGANPRIAVFNQALNGEYSSYPLNDPNAYLVAIDSERLGVFQQIGGQLRFSTYDPQRNVFNLEFNLSAGTVTEAIYTKTNNGSSILVFATATELYHYQVGSFVAPQLDPGLSLSNFRLERATERLYLQNGNAVQSYMSPGNLIFGTSFSGTLKDFDLLYNK